jgi:multiple sugar transport system permease protein
MIATEKSDKGNREVGGIGIYLILSILALITLLPIVWVIASSFQTDKQIFVNLMPFNWKAIFPLSINFDSYLTVLVEKHFARALFNSLFVTFATVLVGIIVNAMCGFAFAVFDFKGKKILFGVILITFMIPFESIALPLYQVVNRFGWLDTYQALIIPAVANGLAIFLFRQFFTDIPKDYIDACRIDGASWWKIFAGVYLPLSKPAVISAGLIIFIFQWESFLWPLIAGRTEQLKVIQIAIADLSDEHLILWSQIFAASSIAIVIPALLVTPLQRYYVQGVASTGVKG